MLGTASRRRSKRNSSAIVAGKNECNGCERNGSAVLEGQIVKEWLPNFLSTLTYPSLHRIEIKHIFEDFATLDFEALDAVLSRSQFSSLKAVHFVVHDEDPPTKNRDKVFEEIRGGLPMISSRNLLSLEFATLFTVVKTS